MSVKGNFQQERTRNNAKGKDSFYEYFKENQLRSNLPPTQRLVTESLSTVSRMSADMSLVEPAINRLGL